MDMLFSSTLSLSPGVNGWAGSEVGLRRAIDFMKPFGWYFGSWSKDRNLDWC
jgi:hypothetical protein